MAQPDLTGDAAYNCAEVDFDAGRCQLTPGHDSPHAASVGDAYLTWGSGRFDGWSIEQPPQWLVELPWAPDFAPGTHIGRHRR